MERTEQFVEGEIKKANETLNRCLRVQEMVNTAGYQQTISPLIDKMIMDVVGGKHNGRWHGGLLDRARKDERREFYVGYKQALIDLNVRIMAFVEGVEQLKNKINNLKANKTPKFKTPLVDDTRY